MIDLSGNTFFEGPSGSIEAILKEPAGAITRAAIVCHPHPLFGGTMHNKVVFRIAKAFEQTGFAALRFNFRGAGRSEGQHDEGPSIGGARRSIEKGKHRPPLRRRRHRALQ